MPLPSTSTFPKALTILRSCPSVRPSNLVPPAGSPSSVVSGSTGVPRQVRLFAKDLALQRLFSSSGISTCCPLARLAFSVGAPAGATRATCPSTLGLQEGQESLQRPHPHLLRFLLASLVRLSFLLSSEVLDIAVHLTTGTHRQRSSDLHPPPG